MIGYCFVLLGPERLTISNVDWSCSFTEEGSGPGVGEEKQPPALFWSAFYKGRGSATKNCGRLKNRERGCSGPSVIQGFGWNLCAGVKERETRTYGLDSEHYLTASSPPRMAIIDVLFCTPFLSLEEYV